MNVAIKQILTKRTFRLCHKKNNLCFKAPLNHALQRYYCDDGKKIQKLPPLMEFPALIPVPFPFNYIQKWVIQNFVIRRSVGEDFILKDFIEASKHAVQVVSECLQNNDFEALDGLVTKDAIATLKTSVSKLTDSQRALLAISKDDIYDASPISARVISDDAERRWMEILMCYIVIRDMGKLKPMVEVNVLRDIISNKERNEPKIFLLNYRFRKECTKGVEDSWWIDIINHYC